MIGLLLAGAYLLGSVPFGLVVGRVLKGIDIRQMGSGNIGAANAFRALGPVGGVLVLALDLSKGLLPVLAVAMVPGWVPPEGIPLWQVLAGMAAIIGHNNSMFLGFKGGKGIATTLGVVVGLSWQCALLCLASWIVVVALTRYASLASLCGAVTLPVALWVLDPRGAGRTVYLAFAALAVAFAFYKHRTNIQNLLRGTELKLWTKTDKT